MPGVPETTPADPPHDVPEATLPGETADIASPASHAVKPEPKRAADKVRLRFRKCGALRLLSHHDLMRTFERLLRRSELPFHRSQGFHPKPRLIFALSLPLGVIGCREVVELELDEVLPLEEIHARLARQTPPGLDILSAHRIPPRTNAQVSRLAYALPVPEDRLPDLSRRISEVLAANECWIQRHRPHSGKPGRRLDVRPFLADVRVVHRSDDDPRCLVEMLLHLTRFGTARPEEVLGLLGLEDLLDAGAVLERTRLELFDELPPSETDGAPELEKGSHEKRDAD